MSWTDFLIVFLTCAITMLICRVVPLFVLKGRDLSPTTKSVLSFIPPAAFAALVANDLLSPGMFDAGFWPAALPIFASLIVVIVARVTNSLVVCAIVGVVAYALFSLI